jgi:ABC-type uncharacterized transport system substrate-binding protein
MIATMKRRAFITLLGGAVAAWPLTARAQQAERMRRIGVLAGLAEDDPEIKARLAAFRQGLEKRGWSEGRNVHIDYRFGLYRFAPGSEQVQMLAKELIALQPDAILAQSTPVVAALQRETRTLPIVLAAIADPIGSGFVASLPRPGGNATGFMSFEVGLSAKWLELLKERTRPKASGDPSNSCYSRRTRPIRSATLPGWRGVFIHSRRQLFANALMAASRVAS